MSSELKLKYSCWVIPLVNGLLSTLPGYSWLTLLQGFPGNTEMAQQHDKLCLLHDEELVTNKQ